MQVGDRVRWRDRMQLGALAMGDVVMTVVEPHPIARGMWKVRGPDGYEDWVHEDSVWRLYPTNSSP